MSTIQVVPEPTVVDIAPGNPSMTDLRAFMKQAAAPEPAEPAKEPAKEPEAKTVAPEVEAKPAETEKTEVVTGATEKQEPEEVEEELPEGVKKRIAKEVKKQAQIDAEINRVRSTTKAKEAELAKLKADTDKPGSEPVKTTESAKEAGRPARPKRPRIAEKGFEQETFEEFQARESVYEDEIIPKYEEKLAEWLVASAEKNVEAKLTAKQREVEAKRDWDEAAKEHGAKFQEYTDTVIANSSELMQTAISAFGNWAGMTVHLAKNPDELKEIADKFETNPYGAIADLGRLEDRLKPAPKTTPAKAAEKPLPAPPAKVGGAAAAEVGIDLEAADMSTFKRAWKAAVPSR